MKKDFKIPPNHLIQYYLKALNPKELDNFHSDSLIHLNKIIISTNNQIEFLHRIKADEKWRRRYEKRNFLRFIGKEKINEHKKEFEKINKQRTDEDLMEQKIFKNASLLNFEHQKQINNEIDIVKVIDENIKKLGYDKYNLTPMQKSHLNELRKSEILRKNISGKIQKTSETELLKEQKNKRMERETKVNFFNNNENIDLNSYNLNYEQRKMAIKGENILENFNDSEINMIEATLKNEKKENKKISEIKKRQEIEASLRRKKKYHKPEIKKMKTSLDKYSNEDQYYFIKGIKENGITLNKNRGDIKI